MPVKEKVYLTGEPDSPLQSKSGKPIDIEWIRNNYSKDNLWIDEDFPAVQESLGELQGDKSAASGAAAKKYTWVRPHELAKNAGVEKPSFAAVQDQLTSTELCSAYDLRQGGLGDCWYVSALQALVKRQDYLKWVIREDNFHGFDDDKYCGAFHFRFFDVYHGKWVDVVVDDQIPSIGEEGSYTPAFTKITPSKDGKHDIVEFWPALIEKAFAKFNGSYALLEGGLANQALENLTGGFGEFVLFGTALDPKTVAAGISQYDAMKYKISKIMKDGNFLSVGSLSLTLAKERGVLDGYTNYRCAEFKNPGYKYNEETGKFEDDPTLVTKGLCKGHAYSVLDAVELKTKDGAQILYLVKIKNPHACHEWTGDFGDNDDVNWARMEKDLRAKNQKNDSYEVDEGIFWIELADVLKYYQSFEICILGFGISDCAQVSSVWPKELQSKAIDFQKSHFKHCSAFKFQAAQKCEESDINRGEAFANKCLVAITLVMDGFKSNWKKVPWFDFYLYKVTEEELASINNKIECLDAIYTGKEPALEGGSNMLREVNKWTTLEPGHYIIVPVLYTEPDEGEKGGELPLPDELIGKDIPYTIRIWTEVPTKLEPVLMAEGSEE